MEISRLEPGSERLVDAAVRALRGHAPQTEALELIKDTKSQVYRLAFEGQFYYLKVYPESADNRLRLKQALRPPRRLYDTARRLLAAEVPTPAPVAALEVDGVGVYIMGAARGETLKSLYRNAQRVDRDRCVALVDGVAQTWGRLVAGRFLHMDPIRGNFVADFPGGPAVVQALDVDNIYALPWLPGPVRRHRLKKMARWHLEALVRFWGEAPPEWLLRRFVHRYAAAVGQDSVTAWREWRCVIELLAMQRPADVAVARASLGLSTSRNESD